MAHKLTVICTLVTLFTFVQIEASFRLIEQTYGAEVDDLFKKLEAIVNKYVIQARNEITASINLLKSIASSSQNEADTEMRTAQKALLGYLDKEKAKAEAKLININDCLENGQYEQKLHSLPTEYHEIMIVRATTFTGNASKLGQDTLDKITAWTTELDFVKEEIEKCRSSTQESECLERISRRIKQDITTLPKKIEVFATLTVVSIKEMQESVADCATSATFFCIDNMQTAYGYMYVCIEARLVH